MTPHPNLIHFARMAQPSAASMPPQGYSAPAMPMRPPMPQRAPMRGAADMASQGRGGDSMMAHLTPGEIAVPPEVQTPEVLAALNRAFAQVGANPTSFQAGNPDQKVNPETGAPEFGFFDILLPLGLGVAGSMLGGPLIGAELGSLGVGETTAGILGGSLGGAAGSFAGNAILGKPLDQSLASAAGGAAGSALLGGAMSGLNFGGATPVPEVGPGAGLASDAIRNPANLADLTGGGLSATGRPLTAAAVTTNGGTPVPAISSADINSLAAAWDKAGALSPSATSGPIPLPDRGVGDWFSDKIGNMNLKQTIGSALGGQIGSSLAESYFPAKAPATDLGPHLAPVGPVGPAIGGGPASSGGVIPYGAPRKPPAGYRPGIDPQFDYFPR